MEIRENLQYRLSSGGWVNCEKRTEEFLLMCEEYNRVDVDGDVVQRFSSEHKPLTRSEVLAMLRAGHTLRNDEGDWYDQCRFEPIEKIEKIEKIKAGCGCTIDKRGLMGASLGTSCSNCYDRMSA